MNDLNLSNLSPNDVKNNLIIFQQLISELMPTIDVHDLALIDLVLLPSALLHTYTQQKIKTAIKYMNIKNYIDSTDISDDIVDGLAANWNIARKKGTKATGYLKISLSKKTNFVIPKGTKFFTCNNDLCFYNDHIYTVRYDNGGNMEPHDLKLNTSMSNTFYFMLPVVALNIGFEYNIEPGNKFKTKLKIPNLLDIENISSFINGADHESNKSVLLRLYKGLRINRE